MLMLLLKYALLLFKCLPPLGSDYLHIPLFLLPNLLYLSGPVQLLLVILTHYPLPILIVLVPTDSQLQITMDKLDAVVTTPRVTFLLFNSLDLTHELTTLILVCQQGAEICLKILLMLRLPIPRLDFLQIFPLHQPHLLLFIWFLFLFGIFCSIIYPSQSPLFFFLLKQLFHSPRCKPPRQCVSSLRLTQSL